MHQDQLSIGAATVSALIREQFPALTGEPVRELSAGGTVNAIFRIGEGFASRFPLQPSDPIEAAEALDAEAAAMTDLATHSPFPTPNPVHVGHPSHSYPMPWSIQTWVPGETATPEGLAGSLVFAEDLVSLIRALRKAETHGRTFSGGGRGGNLTDHDDWMERCFTESDGLLDVARLRRLWDRLRRLPSGGPDVMSHGDLTPANLLVRGEHLVGVIDGGGFAPADPALDLVAAWHLLAREPREALREGLACSDTEWQRGGAWAFQQAMGLVWYYERSNPEMATLGRSTLQRLSADDDIQSL